MTAKAKAFTLIELLVVVAIIALLVTILVPSLVKARAQAKMVVCKNNIRTLAVAFLLYGESTGAQVDWRWYNVLRPWLGKELSTLRIVKNIYPFIPKT